MAKDKLDNHHIHFRVSEALKRKWDKALDDRRTTMQQAGVGLIEWVVRQPPQTQAIIFGMIPDPEANK